jgi:peptide-methionine (S)-S-oxide reductase
MKTKIAVFANGCFWCTEAVFSSLKGVVAVASGYTGGTVPNPTYDLVSGGSTDHAEAIQIEYDPSVISYDDLLAVFFNTHNPTTLNRQGNDVGTQYRSAIFYGDDEQKERALALLKELKDTKAYDTPVVTEVQPLGEFYPAEEYHRDYYALHKDQPYCQIVIAPKLEKLQKQFAQLVK